MIDTISWVTTIAAFILSLAALGLWFAEDEK
jgi:hypothetical protein